MGLFNKSNEANGEKQVQTVKLTDLLASAGLMLTNNSKADVIVSFCIENGIYDIFEVNALLFKFRQPILG